MRRLLTAFLACGLAFSAQTALAALMLDVPGQGLRFKGSVSGSIIVKAPATAGSGTITLPSLTGTLATRVGTTVTGKCLEWDVSGNIVTAASNLACGAGGGAGGYATILDEAGALAIQTTLNFVGAGVTCVDNAGATRTDCTIPGGLGYATILDEAGALTARGSLNFVGAGVTCVDNAGATRTDCTIATGAGTVTNAAALTANNLIAGAGANAAAITDISYSAGILNVGTGLRTGMLEGGFVRLNGATSGVVSIYPYASGATYSFLLPSGPGTAGQCLTSGAGTSAMSWGTCGGSAAFSGITSATNTTAAMVCGAGCSLNYTSTGTINASTVAGGTVANVWSAKTVDPATTDNTALGYLTGDDWINTTANPDRVWRKTAESGGVAVWVQLDNSQTDAIVTWTNKTYNVESTGNVFTMPVKRWYRTAKCLNATAESEWDLPAATPAVAACVTGTNITKGVLQFADTSGGFSAQYTDILPADWTTSGGVDAKIVWTAPVTSGDVKWTLSTACTRPGVGVTDDPAFTAQTGTTTVTGAASQPRVTILTGVSMTGCVTTDAGVFHLKVFRDGADAADTIGVTADVLGVELTFRRAT